MIFMRIIQIIAIVFGICGTLYFIRELYRMR